MNLLIVLDLFPVVAVIPLIVRGTRLARNSRNELVAGKATFAKRHACAVVAGLVNTFHEGRHT